MDHPTANMVATPVIPKYNVSMDYPRIVHGSSQRWTLTLPNEEDKWSIQKRLCLAAEGDMRGLLQGLGTALLATGLFTSILRLAWYCFSDTLYLLSVAPSYSFSSASCEISNL